jgi:hypothetical protein
MSEYRPNGGRSDGEDEETNGREGERANCKSRNEFVIHNIIFIFSIFSKQKLKTRQNIFNFFLIFSNYFRFFL